MQSENLAKHSRYTQSGARRPHAHRSENFKNAKQHPCAINSIFLNFAPAAAQKKNKPFGLFSVFYYCFNFFNYYYYYWFFDCSDNYFLYCEVYYCYDYTCYDESDDDSCHCSFLSFDLLSLYCVYSIPRKKVFVNTFLKLFFILFSTVRCNQVLCASVQFS